MHFVRKSALLLAGVMAALFLILAAIDAGVVKVVGSPDPIKQTLADSGIYESIIPGLLEDAEIQASKAGDIPFNHEIVRSAAEATFSSDYLRSQSNHVIDSLYRWLDGETAVPDFRIDLSAKKADFANRVADGVEQRVAGLPRCSGTARGDFNAFTADCRPAGVTAAQVATAVRDGLLNSENFMSDPVISGNEVKSSESGQLLFSESFKDAPEAYQTFKSSPLVISAIALLALAAVFFLSVTRLAGLKHLGFILLGTGIFLVLLAVGANESVNNKVVSQINIENQTLQENVRQLTRDLTARLSNSFLIFGSAYAGAGALMMAGFYYLRRRQPTNRRPTQHAG